MIRTYSQGITVMKKIEQIEAVKIGEKGKKTKVNLYYKDLDDKIKPVNSNIITEKFLSTLQKKFIEKYGKVASKDNYILIYINKDILDNKVEFLQFLIDGKELISKKNKNTYIEVPIKKINQIKLEEEKYIKSLYISINATVETAHELKELGGKALID